MVFKWPQSTGRLTVAQYYYCILTKIICHEISTFLPEISRFLKISIFSRFKNLFQIKPEVRILSTGSSNEEKLYLISYHSKILIELRSVKLWTSSKQVQTMDPRTVRPGLKFGLDNVATWCESTNILFCNSLDNHCYNWPKSKKLQIYTNLRIHHPIYRSTRRYRRHLCHIKYLRYLRFHLWLNLDTIQTKPQKPQPEIFLNFTFSETDRKKQNESESYNSIFGTDLNHLIPHHNIYKK